ncbi:hypothetical protein LP420_20985 [Massilia sp. B-10]|nr:hypothetical protein LP420_20985 [Massilia sp. B-10]
MMIPGMYAGKIQEFLGYQHFFMYVCLMTLLSLPDGGAGQDRSAVRQKNRRMSGAPARLSSLDAFPRVHHRRHGAGE